MTQIGKILAFFTVPTPHMRPLVSQKLVIEICPKAIPNFTFILGTDLGKLEQNWRFQIFLKNVTLKLHTFLP